MRLLRNQEFIDKVKKVHAGRYDYSQTNYVNSRSKVNITCPKHGVFSQLPTNHWQGAGCPKCKAEKTSEICTYTTDKFVQLAQTIHGQRYDYSLTEYVKADKKVIITCLIHGRFTQTPANHLQGQRCPDCAIDDKIKLQTLTTKEFVERSNIVHNSRYDYSVTKYVHGKQKVKIKCHVHGEFEQLPSNHLKGHGCLACKSSRGEELIAQILTNHDVKYIREYKLPNVDYKFRYDFYLPDLNILIEFHGIQHYHPIEFFGGQEGLKQTQFRDLIKKDLARTMRIKILYLNYVDLDRLSEEQFKDRLIKALQKFKNSRTCP